LHLVSQMNVISSVSSPWAESKRPWQHRDGMTAELRHGTKWRWYDGITVKCLSLYKSSNAFPNVSLNIASAHLHQMAPDYTDLWLWMKRTNAFGISVSNVALVTSRNLISLQISRRCCLLPKVKKK
jgi:hypothetical protein